MLYIFGDIHFSKINPWNFEVGEKFINWFETFAQETEKNDQSERSILWLGDITERDVNPGDVVDQVHRLFLKCSKYFHKVYVVMGNHDLKLYRGEPQFFTKFLENIPHVHVIEKPEEIMINGTLVRALPFMRIENMSIEDYYSNMRFDKDVDLTVGHWNKENPNAKIIKGVNIDNMRSKMFCLGHIHNRVDSDYTGSVFPNSTAEEGERVYKIFNDGKLIKEVLLPTFLKYDTIEFPKEIKTTSDDAVHVYTVMGTRNLSLAKEHYKGKYIKGIKNIIENKDQKEVKSSEIFTYKSNEQAFKDFIKETEYKMSEKANKMVLELLKED